MIPGLDVCLVGKYQQVALANWPQGFACGAFLLESGDIYGWVDKLLATGKCPAFRGQMLWHPNHLYSDADIPNITHLAQRYEQLALKYQNIPIWLSPFCEAANIHDPDKYLSIIAKNAPHCKPIWTPINNVWSQNFANETHGGGPSGHQIRSGDGGINNHDDLDLNITHEKEKHAGCEIFFYWICHFNGHFHMPKQGEPFVPIDQRTGWPTPQEIQATAMLATDKGGTNVPKGICWKSNSEDHGPTDIKAEKGCLIAPQKAHNGIAILKAQNGAPINQLQYFGVYSDHKSSRYYSDIMGAMIAKHAIQISGSPLCDIWIDGKVVAKINPAFYENNL